MVIGIMINGVIRDYLNQISDVHTKYFPPNEGEEPIKPKGYDLSEWLEFPLETNGSSEIEFNPTFNEDNGDESLVTEYKVVETRTTIDEFLYERCSLEVFGSASESEPNVVNHLNDMIQQYENIDFVLFGEDKGLSIPATHFFLSKTSCRAKKVVFYSEVSDVWEYCDVLVTDNKFDVGSKPELKKGTIVMVNREHNIGSECDIRVDSLKDLDLNKIWGYNTTQ